MNWNLRTCAILFAILVVVFAAIIFSKLNCGDTTKITKLPTQDTTTIVDTIIVFRDSIRVIDTAPAKLDSEAVIIDSLKPLVVQTASIDTAINSDSISIKYYFPPVNRFTIKLQSSEKIRLIRELQTVPYLITKEEAKLQPLLSKYIGELPSIDILGKSFFDRFHHGIYVGAGYGMINNKPDVFIGYGIGFEL